MNDPVDLLSWVGSRAEARFRLDPWPTAALGAALDREGTPVEDDPLPPFWHHLYGQAPVRASETGTDGHPKRGGFLPPVPLPRRMWAGGRLRFDGPLLLGNEVTRSSEVKAVTSKVGRQGPLTFVLVEHTLRTDRGVAVVEEHDIVYRDAGSAAPPSSATPAPEPGQWQRTWQPDEVLLFRYSALTYNGHRIHYDRPYVTTVEGYPGLIVHGPLLATLMLELVRDTRPDSVVRRFSFRAMAPVFVGDPILVHGEPSASEVRLGVVRADGSTAMTGEVTLDRPA